MNTKLVWLKLWVALSVLACTGLAVGSLMPTVALPTSDKLMHVLGYAMVGAWCVQVTVGRTRCMVLIGLFLLGVVLEVLQGYVGRVTDYRDAIANGVGVWIAFVLGLTPLANMLVRMESLLKINHGV